MKKYLKKINNYYKKNGLKNTVSWLYNCGKYQLRLRNAFRYDYNYKDINKNGFINKETKSVFIFATVNYYDIGGGQRSSQFAKTFEKMGFKVYYIYGFKSYESKQIAILNPSLIHINIKDFSIDSYSKLINKDDLVIFEAPFIEFKKYFEYAKKIEAKIVYESIDNWEDSELGKDIFDIETLNHFVKNADLITCTAKPLVNQMESYLKKNNVKKNVLYSPNAVDDELFNPRKKYNKPYDLVLGKKTLLYYGSLWGTWFDWDIIFDLAVKNPRISINLVGDYYMISDIVSNAPKNIHFLGLKPQSELPAYLFYSDYAILPFKNNNIGKYVSPLKIFEYISMNKKIISTSLPDILGYPNVSYCDNFNDWDAALNSEQSNIYSNEICEKFSLENNWYFRISIILDMLYKSFNDNLLNKFQNNVSVVVLNYNNSNVIFRCVDTILSNNMRYNCEIIVVDNNSIDGSYEKLLSKYNKNTNVKIIRNTKNGCSSGRNLGVKNAENDYIVFLDSDEWVTNKYWLDNYLYLVNKYGDKTVVGWNAGWFKKDGYAYHVVDSFPFRYLDPHFIATEDIGYLATCGFIINKNFFEEIGGFDLNYDPTCYEDTDLSLAVRNASGNLLYSRFLGVCHLPHQTTKSGTAQHTKLINEKGEYFVKKWKKINYSLIRKYIK